MDRGTFYDYRSRESLIQLVQQSETPGYFYFPDIVRGQIEKVRGATNGRFDVHYAVKANPSLAMLRLMAAAGVGADVASGGELRAALEAGIPPANIEFSGPGKRPGEITEAIEAGIASINIESLAEIDVVAACAEAAGRVVRVGLRLNPGTPSSGRGGLTMAGDTQFGIPKSELPEALSKVRARKDRLEFTGFHAHFASQELDAEALVGNMRTLLEAAVDLAGDDPGSVSKLNFGGGWGIPYFPHQGPLDLGGLRAALADVLAEPAYQPLLENTRLIVEPGRFLAGESGVFATRVLYVKRAESKTFAITDGGMNANYVLAGGMGSVIRRNFELDVLPTGKDPVPGPFDVAGPLCTPQDVLATNIQNDRGVAPGDTLVFFNCGAYGPTASPLGFLSHPRPGETLISAEHLSNDS